MKNFKLPLLMLMAVAFIVTSCSSDDDGISFNNIEETPEVINVSINEFSFLDTDRVEIVNQGNEAADISNYWLCLGPGTYSQINELTIVSGTTTIPVGGFLVVEYSLPDTDAGIGLYSSNTNFGDATTIVDFVQYGAGGSARENVAVEAGIWTAGDFVNVSSTTSNSIVYDGAGNNVSDWAETTTTTFGSENIVTAPIMEDPSAAIIISEVAFLGNQVELFNTSSETVDASGLWLCLGSGTYRQLSALTVANGSLNIPAGGYVVVEYNMPSASGGLGLYANNSGFGDASTIVDFVQYGAGGSQRENVAVEAGIWTAGDFVIVSSSTTNTIAYDGEGNSASDWAETTSTTFGNENIVTTPIIEDTNSVIIINEVAFLGNQVELFNTSTETVDASGLWLCLGAGTYRQLSALTVTNGSLNIPAGGFVVVEYNMPRVSGGLGLYANNTGFGDASTILDFVQYGAGGSQRENVAVEAGIWTAGDFITVSNSTTNTIAYDGEGNSASDWIEGTNTFFAAN